MQGVSYVIATGLGWISRFADQLKSADGKLVLIAISPKIREIFDMSGLIAFIKKFNSMEEAIEYFRNNS